ncbi:hypothetical protein FQR65_LT05430 [Abscondita terminalis]|nr:hypothetical protein FQR65_LT05430 [Abscondita terminalis]
MSSEMFMQWDQRKVRNFLKDQHFPKTAFVLIDNASNYNWKQERIGNDGKIQILPKKEKGTTFEHVRSDAKDVLVPRPLGARTKKNISDLHIIRRNPPFNIDHAAKKPIPKQRMHMEAPKSSKTSSELIYLP